jgi:murein L,D-transpeptidase YcbB/YkuD
MAEQPDLVPGHTGEWVTYLQQLLNYHQVGRDFQAETYCGATESAVRELQRRNGLPETGHCDAATWECLTAEATGGDGEEELVIAFSVEDNVETPEEEVEVSDVDQLPDSVAVS